jgi:hypothetical protein
MRTMKRRVEGPVLLAKKTKGKNEIFIARTPW